MLSRTSSKRDFTNCFNKLKLFGFEVITYNDKRPLRKAQKNFVDHFIFDSKYLIFVEIKIGNDKLSPGQDNIGRKLSSASVHNKNTFYKVIRTLEDAQRLVDHLVKGDL